MKKVFLGLLVAGVALAGSAFTNVKFAVTYYSLNKAGTTYKNAGLTNPSASCISKPTNPSCVISYPSDQGATLTVGSLPSGFTNVSAPGWINP